jgi:hypothetical protein
MTAALRAGWGASMEQISFTCPACHRTLKAGVAMSGLKARCKCGAHVLVPEAPEEGVETIPLVDEPGSAPAARAGEDRPAIPQVREDDLLPRDPPGRPRLTLDEDEELLPPVPGKGHHPAGRAGDELALPPAGPRDLLADEPALPAPASRPAADEADDDGQTYGLKDSFDVPPAPAPASPKRLHPRGDEDEEEDEEKEDGKKEEEAPRRPRRPLGKIPVDQDQWRAVQLGCYILAIGMVVWASAFALQRLFVLVGALGPMEYAGVASEELTDPDQPVEAGVARRLDRTNFILGLIAGSSFLTLGEWILRLALVLALAQTVMTAFGYATWLGGPSQLGMRRLSMAGLAVAGASFLVIFLFKFLPLTMLIRYIMIPFLAPEVAMLTANGDRIDPIHITWSGAPFVEVFFALLFHMVLLAEPVLIAVYLRSAAQALKIESLQETTDGVIRLGLGTAFINLCYFLLMNAGCSPPLLLVLRAIYLLGTGFFLGLLLWLAFVLLRSRDSIERVLRVGWVA